MRNPFKKKALTGSPAVIDAVRDRGWAPYPLLGGGNRQRILDAYNTAQSANLAWIYAHSPAVRTVVDVIVRNMGQLDLRLYEEISESERQPKPDHPAAMSLRYPNEETSADSWIRSMVKDFLIHDNAYSVLQQAAAGGQMTLSWVPAHMVEIMGSSLFRADCYRVHRRDGTWVDYTDDASDPYRVGSLGQVLQWRGENPNDPRMGLSRLDTLRDVIAEDVALQQATVELANAGLTEPAWVFRPLDAPEWDNEARKGFEEDLTNRMRRRNKMPVVLEEGMEMRSFGVSPKDAEMMAVRRWAIERVASLYGVPLGMVGLADDLEKAQSQFYADTLPPYCEEFTKMLNQRILVRVYNWTDGCFEFNLDEKLMGDDRIKTLVAASGRPVMTSNEARAKLNLTPLDIGDELVTPLNVIVGENPKPAPQVMPPQDPNKPPQDGSYRDPNAPKALADVISGQIGGYNVAPRAYTSSTKAEERLPQLHPGRKQDLERQHRNIDLAQGVIGRQFNRLERSLRDKQRKARTFSADDVDWSRWDREFSDEIHGLLEQIVEKEGTIYAFKLAGSFDMGQVHNYLRAMAEGASEALMEKVREELDTFGFDGTLPQRGVHVESGGVSLGGKATMWARKAAAQQSPDYESRVKIWIPDTARHAEFGGQTVPVGDPWPAGFAPGSAPGCRCSMSIS